MDSLQLFSRRMMYRGRFQQRKIAPEDLRKLVDAARWAPSGHNSQPWEFLAVDDASTIARLARIAAGNLDDFLATSDALAEWVARWYSWLRWSEDELQQRGDGILMRKSGEGVWRELAQARDEAERRSALVALFASGGQPSKLITTAPCLLFTLLDRERKIPDCSNDLMALTSAGAAMQNLRLAAELLGMGAHEQSPLYDLPQTRSAVRAELGVPENFEIVGAMRLGYPTEPSESLKTHVRRPVRELLHVNRFRPRDGG